MPGSNKNKIHSKKKYPVVVSLFAGAGGLDLGFEQAGFDVRVAIEMDKRSCETLRLNRPEKAVIEKDIKSVTPDEIRAAAGIGAGEVFAVIGGPPCQGFSPIGKRNPKDPRNYLYREYFRIVAGIKPRYFLMENTSALLSPRNRTVFLEILEAGMKAGYAVGYTQLNAAAFGVPQHRRRAFVFGHRMPDLQPLLLPPTTVGNAIADLADVEVYHD